MVTKRHVTISYKKLLVSVEFVTFFPKNKNQMRKTTMTWGHEAAPLQLLHFPRRYSSLSPVLLIVFALLAASR